MADEKCKEIPDIYCNGVQMAISPYDLLIELQLSSPATAGEKPVFDTVGKVRMSLEHAKVLAILLKKNLKGYEQQTNGKIRLHPDFLREIGVSDEEDWL